MTLVRAALVLALVASAAWSTRDTSADLEEAKELYRQGRFGVAVAKLQTVVLGMEQDGDPGSLALREEAYLYLGLAYVALDDPEAAADSFKALLRLVPDRRLDEQVYAPKVIEAFEEARRQVTIEGIQPPPAEEYTRTTTTSVEDSEANSGGSSATGYALLGAAAGGGGVALITALTGSSTTTSTSSTTSTTTTSVPPEMVEVDLRVNGVKQGIFSCSRAVVFTIDVINSTSQVINVEGFDLNLISLTPSTCQTHRPPVDGTVNLDLLPEARVQIRQMDLAGDLCRTPGRQPGCEWRGVVTVVTSDGDFQSDVQFTTEP